MSQLWRKPTFVIIDFARGIAARYVPKIMHGGFYREEAKIADAEGNVGNFGGPEGLALVERFRTGAMQGQQYTQEQDQPQPEVA